MTAVARQVDLEEAIAAVWPFGALPRKGFKLIAADAPWRYVTWSEVNQDRAAANHYDVMGIEQIMALPVADLADDDCVLLLLAINPMLPHALKVMEAWGFTYKTIAFTWAKTTKRTDWSWAPKWHMGLGHWTRANTELCLLGTRGKPKRADKGVRQLLLAPLREHSRKPDEFYAAAERLVAGPRLEMFARQSRKGWVTWGNQMTKFDGVA
jgi:N6-adenosine-specific RNA methylase IME4